jgi:RNA polymerase sigma-70 factor, ECF subfamily
MERSHVTAADDLRPLMFSIAYRMVGSVGVAEDLVQEAYLRLHQTTSDGARVESEKAFLTTVTTRLAIDHLRSARVRREQYVGPWMPEPLVGEAERDPAEQAELADSLSVAFLVLLEKLSPVERAVFVLHDVFDYGFEEIAQIVERSEENCRQIAVRARRRVEQGEPRFEPSLEQREELARRFFAAFEEGEMDGLVELLARDVVFVGDGGGKATAIPEPVHGAARVGRMLWAFANQARRWQLSLEPAIVNAQPGAIVRDPRGRVVNVVALDIAGGEIQVVRSIVNPEKLGHLGELTDLTRPRRG